MDTATIAAIASAVAATQYEQPESLLGQLGVFGAFALIAWLELRFMPIARAVKAASEQTRDVAESNARALAKVLAKLGAVVLLGVFLSGCVADSFRESADLIARDFDTFAAASEPRPAPEGVAPEVWGEAHARLEDAMREHLRALQELARE